MERSDIYRILDSEREYQDQKWVNDVHRKHEVECWILYMQHYLDEARKEATLNDDAKVSLASLRKVVALGVACFEVHGVPERK